MISFILVLQSEDPSLFSWKITFVKRSKREQKCDYFFFISSDLNIIFGCRKKAQ